MPRPCQALNAVFRVVGVLDVPQQAIDGRWSAATGLAEHALHGPKAAQSVATRRLSRPGTLLAQLRIISAAELVLGSPTSTRCPDGLLRGTFNCLVNAPANLRFVRRRSGRRPWLVALGASNGLATSPRLKPAANTGLAATVRRQDRAKPREISSRQPRKCRS